jgi:hypothetical protein
MTTLRTMHKELSPYKMPGTYKVVCLTSRATRLFGVAMPLYTKKPLRMQCRLPRRYRARQTMNENQLKLIEKESQLETPEIYRNFLINT